MRSRLLFRSPRLTRSPGWRRGPLPLGALPQPFMQLLAAELDIRLAQHGQQGLLPGPKGRRVLIGGMDVVSHGRSASGATLVSAALMIFG